MTTKAIRFFPSIPTSLTPEQAAFHVKLLYQALNDHDEAIGMVNGKVASGETSPSTPSTPGGGGSGSGSTGLVNQFPGLGTVNDQTGNNSYTTQTSDNGAKVVFGASSPATITLNSAVGTPWFCFIDNNGSASVTLNPDASSTVAGDTVIPPYGFAIVFFGGSSFYVRAGISANSATLFSGTVNLAPLTSGGTQGTITIVGGLVTDVLEPS